jgi:putative two-component system response regulator
MLQKKYNFLVADDEFPIVKIISDILTLHPSTNAIFSANDGERALQMYKNNKVDIVFTDILMPRLSGIELIRQLKELNSDVHIIVVSAYSNIDLVRDAIRNGAYDYILKPFSVDEIMFSVNRIIDRLKLLDEKANYVASLEKRVAEVTESLQNSFFDTLNVILNALEARSRHTLDHSNRMAAYSGKLAIAAGLNEKIIAGIRVAGVLHDIGKISIPDEILLKPGQLTPEEYEVIKTHPVIGKKIVLPILNRNQDILDIIFHHHERFDGKGYPDGLAGKNIPLTARIAMIANSYAAMTMESCYKGIKSKEEAIAELKKESEKQFDPKLVNVFIDKVLSEE